jgi:carboxylesterase type B
MSTLFTTAYATNQLPFNVTQANETLSQMPPPPLDGRITEDCLVLDVLVPQKVFNTRTINKQGVKTAKGAPVLVWIYVSIIARGSILKNQRPNNSARAVDM